MRLAETVQDGLQIMPLPLLLLIRATVVLGEPVLAELGASPAVAATPAPAEGRAMACHL